VWAGLGDGALSEEESLRLAGAERAAMRGEKRSARQAD
jgi:hypothetical protein